MSWAVFGRIATVTGFTDNITNGSSKVVEKIYTSPEGNLTGSWKKLEQIQKILQGLSAKRRRRINAAAKNGHGKSLAEIEAELEAVQDRYYMLNLQSQESSYLELYMPFGSFRQRVDLLNSDIKELLLDTMNTTVSVLDDEERAALANPARRKPGPVPPGSPSTGPETADASPTTPGAPGSFGDIPLNAPGSGMV